jgi:hypothetical protein
MDVGEWQSRLEDAFSEGGIVGPYLLDVIALERAYGEHYIATFHGQSVLMDSFQSFFVETLRRSERWIVDNGWPEDCAYYGAILVCYLTVFRSFRACQNLLLAGYPLDGFALLRDIKDRAILYCAMAKGLSSWSAIHTLDKSKRLNEERRIFDLLIGKHSGICPDDLKTLELWKNMFDQEVHGSKLTLVLEMSRLREGGQLSPGPLPHDRQLAMYMNRAVETGWLFARLLPGLQPVAGAFGPEWLARCRILDDSFRVSEQVLADMGKRIATVFTTFIDQTFTFGDEVHYVEAVDTEQRDD